MNQTVKYLCVDDEETTSTESFRNNLSGAEARLLIEPSLPDIFSEEVDNLKRSIVDNEYSGLLLDLRLDGPGSKAHYRAPALVQEIHTRAAEKDFPVLPLILWSNDIKLNISYWPDDTSHDLFDLTVYKEKLAGNDLPYATEKARKMVALVDGYEMIRSCNVEGVERAATLLQKSVEFVSQLDPRLLYPITKPLSESSIFDQARFIHRQLLNIPNSALVSSEILAARLGLDIREVPNFDDAATELFPNARYTGAFAYGWPCWWMPIVEKDWQNMPKSPGVLRQLTAEQRVAFINSSLKRDDYKPAQGIEWTKSKAFWTVCQITRKPLDPRNGYVVNRQLYPWQLTQYLSLHGKLDGSTEANRIDIDPLDIERFDDDKATTLAALKK
ncbi:hypothetical protein [Hymenobacter sp. APR13]|uniref:hypothetical protein n=1 Tax=Hymenobacter sp. APR13 TaxID=1356852 RepID=UPI0012DFF0DF|nr:hypothetical protein [Hymenobacter sp. APR13]